MLYANFGHNAMNYTTNTRTVVDLRQRGAEPVADRRPPVARRASTTPHAHAARRPTRGPDLADRLVHRRQQGHGKCVDARAAGTANGTAIQQYTCNATNAQQFQFQPTSGGFVRINNRSNSAQALDVTNVSSADNAPIQTWTYGGGNNQQWQPVSEGGGCYHFVSRLQRQVPRRAGRVHRRQRAAGPVHLQRHGGAVVPAGAASVKVSASGPSAALTSGDALPDLGTGTTVSPSRVGQFDDLPAALTRLSHSEERIVRYFEHRRRVVATVAVGAAAVAVAAVTVSVASAAASGCRVTTP